MRYGLARGITAPFAEGTMSRHRMEVWDLNYVTVIMSESTKHKGLIDCATVPTQRHDVPAAWSHCIGSCGRVGGEAVTGRRRASVIASWLGGADVPRMEVAPGTSDRFS